MSHSMSQRLGAQSQGGNPGGSGGCSDPGVRGKHTGVLPREKGDTLAKRWLLLLPCPNFLAPYTDPPQMPTRSPGNARPGATSQRAVQPLRPCPQSNVCWVSCSAVTVLKFSVILEQGAILPPPRPTCDSGKTTQAPPGSPTHSTIGTRHLQDTLHPAKASGSHHPETPAAPSRHFTARGLGLH